MSEQKKMTILQPGEPAPNVGQPPQVNNPGTVSAADTMGGPMTTGERPVVKTKKRALPGKDEVWTTAQEMLALKRVATLLEGMPPKSLRRIRGYVIEMIDESLEPPSAGAPAVGPIPYGLVR